MYQLFLALFVLMIGYNSYRIAKRRGEWSWRQFFIVIGSIAVFTVVFIIPLAYSSWMDTRPGLLMTVLLSGIFLFVGTIAYLFRKKPAKPDSRADSSD
jgi:predicted membrane channel-forming protein YqfA (hemolysin III family)